MSLQLTLLIAYLIGIIVFGLVVSRTVRHASDFLVAGRNLGPGLIFATFLAANIGAGSTVGAAGIGYELSLSAWWWVGCAGIGSLILANFVGPAIWRIAKQHDLHTMGDFLDLRYNRAVRGVVASLLWVGTLAILAVQLIAISRILEIVVGWPKWQGCVVGGIVVMAYFTAGGLSTAARVNAVQLVFMLVGFLVAIPFALEASGGWAALGETLSSNRDPSYSSMTGVGPRGILAYIVLLVPAFIVSPGLIQKLCGARDERAVRIGINLNAIGLGLFAFVPVFFGMVAYANFPALADPELALPQVMVELLPSGVGALALAAILSAELSSSDAILFMLSTSLSVDLYKRFLKPDASERRLLQVSRGAAVAGGLLAVALAIALPSIIQGLTIFYGLLGVALFVPTLAGLYSKVPKAGTALWTVIGSVSITVVVYLWTDGTGMGILTPYAIGIICAIALTLARWNHDRKT